MTAVVATLLAALTSSPAPARAGDGSGDRAGDRTGDRAGLTGAEWHRLHPALCHTVGEHPRDY